MIELKILFPEEAGLGLLFDKIKNEIIQLPQSIDEEFKTILEK
jgi:hypothetical protein